jgi:hypothetical protein
MTADSIKADKPLCLHLHRSAVKTLHRMDELKESFLDADIRTRQERLVAFDWTTLLVELMTAFLQAMLENKNEGQPVPLPGTQPNQS